MKEHSIVKLRTLLESDTKLRRLQIQLDANKGDAELARRFYLEAKRQRRRVAVKIGSMQHFITDWHDDNQVTTKTLSMGFSSGIQSRHYNHSNWQALFTQTDGTITLI